MARKGLPKKYAKFGFKKGWKLYKAAQRKRVSGKPARKPAAPRKRTATTSTGARTMPRKRKATTGRRVVYRTVTAPARRRTGRRAPRLLSPATMNTVIDGSLIGIGAIGSTVMINKAPFVKDLNHWFKAAIQAGTGIALMAFFKDKYIKKASMGMVVGSAMSIALPMLPEGMKVFGRRRFSPSELHKLQTLGRPQAIAGRPVTMGRPVSVSQAESTPMMGRTSNRVSRYR